MADMVASAATSRPPHRARAPKCPGSSSCAANPNRLACIDRNQQYSVTALTNASGTITERYTYTAYGQPAFFDGSGTVLTASAESNRYTYTGREWDEDLGLYHYRARMYDALSGRFSSRDPLGYEGSAWGLYVYCENSPLLYLDWAGLSACDRTFGTAMCKAWCKETYPPRLQKDCEAFCKGLKNAHCNGVFAWCKHLLRHKQKKAAEACLAFYANFCK